MTRNTETWSVTPQRLTTLVFGTSVIEDIRRVAKLEPVSHLYWIYQGSSKEATAIAAAWNECYLIYGRQLLTTLVTRLNAGDPALTLFDGFLVLMPRPAAELG